MKGDLKNARNRAIEKARAKQLEAAEQSVKADNERHGDPRGNRRERRHKRHVERRERRPGDES